MQRNSLRPVPHRCARYINLLIKRRYSSRMVAIQMVSYLLTYKQDYAKIKTFRTASNGL